MKPLNLYKYITILLAILFSIFTISCSSTPTTATVSETKISETTQAPTTTVAKTTPATVQETVPPTTKIEYEGVIIPQIEGLRFDKGTFFAKAGNPYGLEAETKAGVFIKDAFELNGVMENSIGLRSEVIEVLQQKYLKENKELKFPIPFNLEKDKGIKMELLENKLLNEEKNLDKYRWDKYTFLGVTLPRGTVIYAPLETKITGEWDGCLFEDYIQGIDGCYSFDLRKPRYPNEEIFYKGFGAIHTCEFDIFAQGSECLISPIKVNKDGFKQTETNIGLPLAVIKNEPNPELDFYFQWGNSDVKNISAGMFFSFSQYVGSEGKYSLNKQFETGEDIFLEMNKIKISILSAQ